MIKYRTKYDGSQESVDRILSVMEMVSMDKFQIVADSDKLKIITKDKTVTILRGGDFCICQNGEILLC